RSPRSPGLARRARGSRSPSPRPTGPSPRAPSASAPPPLPAVEEADQLSALPVGEAAHGLRRADLAGIEKACRLHPPELRHRHEDVDQFGGRDVLGRLVEDLLDPDFPLLEILLQLRAPDANVIRSLEGVHPLVEGADRSVCLGLRGGHGAPILPTTPRASSR